MKPLLGILVFLIGCASSGYRAYNEPPALSLLTVNNLRNEDAAIYVMRDGIRGRRLGQVASYGSATFVLTASETPIASDVQFCAKAFISGAIVLSDAIPAERGANYEWKLGPGRDYAYVGLRYARR
jgi:hypothetical protein